VFKKKYKPSFVVIEKPFMRFVKSTAQLMRVHGVANYIYADIPQYEIPASTVKLLLTGMGNADKKLVAEGVLKLYPNIKFQSEDESDSCAVAISYAMLQGWIEERRPNGKKNIQK
jgi:Holliday junction resolvasome RuvABC endonuclease subunit